MENWKNGFDDWCRETFVTGKTTHSAVTSEYVSRVIDYLKSPEDREILSHLDKSQQAKFKFKVKQKKYSWMTIPAIGSQEAETVLTVPSADGSRSLVVVPIEKFFDTLKVIHENTGHAKVPTMMKKIRAQYEFLPKSAVKQFLQGCISCQCRAPQVNDAEPRQIVATEVFSRVQVDLIDLTAKPSGQFRYILHLMDHFSKFHQILPLERKTTEEVNAGLTKIFGTIGLPHILQADNGSEFSKLRDIFTSWPGGSDVKIIHGRPRHPQSQGLVERGHRLIQDRLAIAEQEWSAENEVPFPWHTRLPIIQYQVNNAHSRVINSTPYQVVFGREEKNTPMFGREAIVVEDREADHDHSFSTAYDLSDAEFEADEEPVQTEVPSVPSYSVNLPDEQPVQTEGPSGSDNSHFQPDEQPVQTEGPSGSDNSQFQPDEEDIQTEDPSGPTNDLGQPDQEPLQQPDQEPLQQPDQEPFQTDSTNVSDEHSSQVHRHEAIRQAARDSTKKANEQRVQPKKRGKRVDKIDVGNFVTLAIPKEDRHRTDQRRLPGIVVNKRGNSQYMIRSQYGVIDGWYRGDTVQLFDGTLQLAVEGWEHCEVIPLSTAAARHRGSNTVATRCYCKGECSNNHCRCKKAKNTCTSTCHAGRSCLNRQCSETPSTPNDDPGEDIQPASDEEEDESSPFPQSINTVIMPVIEDLKENDFSERACENALRLLSGTMRPTVLQHVMTELEPHIPAIPVEKPSRYAAQQLPLYGSGYMKYVPPAMRTSHAVYHANDADNRCLYNSLSIIIYGNESHAARLKLISVLNGISHMDKIIEEIRETVNTPDEVVAWASGFSTEAMIDSLSGDAEFMISRIVENELFSSLTNNDSGPVQIIALAHFLNRRLEVYCVEENSSPREKYGYGPEACSLLRVPLNLVSVDGQIRYNHFVPAIRRTNDEEGELVSMCGARDIGVCNFTTDKPGLEWVQCEDCFRWYHSQCMSDSTRSHTMKRVQSLSCGCLRAGPFTTNMNTVFRDVKKMDKVLRDHRPFLKTLLQDIENQKVPSWRRAQIKPNPTSYSRLIKYSGLTYPSDNVATRLRKFIEQQMPAPIVPRSRIECVLIPELLIRLFIFSWNINRVEAEYILHELAIGHRHLL